MNKSYTKPLEIRYVVFCDVKGVYLGGNRWSRKDPGPCEGAPTFTAEEGDRKCRELASLNPTEIAYDLRLVCPDLPGGFASRNAVADSGLERWEGGIKVR